MNKLQGILRAIPPLQKSKFELEKALSFYYSLSLNLPHGRFSLVVIKSLCVSVHSLLIVDWSGEKLVLRNKSILVRRMAGQIFG